MAIIFEVYLMRSYDEYRQIMRLWDDGMNQSEIEQITGIPRTTVRDCIKRYKSGKELEAWIHEETQALLTSKLRGEVTGDYSRLLQAYAYVLGIYLGDGNISKVRNVLRLRVSLDCAYPNIIAKCVAEL